MFDKLKQILGGSSNPTALADDLIGDRVDGSALGDGIDAIRQTQMLDETVMAPRRESSPAPTKVAKPRRRGSGRRPTGRSKSSVPTYTPTLRPPTAILAAFDDGSTQDAELFRLRGGTHVIGRDAGDVQFPHEVLMSSRHAELQCRLEGKQYVWHFNDLNSRNGSFFRVGRAPLTQGQEFILGRNRLCFRFASIDIDAGPGESGGDDDLSKTQLVGGIRGGDALPEIVVRGLDGSESIHQIARDHIVIGSDEATCALSLPQDPYVSPNHARVFREAGEWKLEDLGSRNATWFRMSSARLDQMTEFQLGEQRFYFRPHAARR
ncbi:MAG: FHA domain-containing protein [Planctomycetota bacterium]